MAYWNHFSKYKYKQIKFSDIKIGEKFRKDFFKDDGVRRMDIICVKTGELTYIEQRSKKEHKYLFVNEYTIVNSFNELND